MRTRVGLSQRQLAALTGLSQPNICAYETGRLRPSAETIERIRVATQPRPSRLIADLRDDIAAAATRHHATDVRVFGSVATGTDTPTSDLDLLVHFTDQASLYDQIDLIDALEELLGIGVDVVSDGAAGIDVEAVPL